MVRRLVDVEPTNNHRPTPGEKKLLHFVLGDPICETSQTVAVFYYVLVPIILTIIFIILYSPYFDKAVGGYVDTVNGRLLTKATIFLIITFVVLAIYVKWQRQVIICK